MNKEYADELIRSLSSNTDIILESITDGVFTVDKNFNITSFNRAAEVITGFSRREAIGKQCRDIFRSNMCEKNCVLRQTMNERKPHISLSTIILNKIKCQISVSVSAAVLRDELGGMIGGVETFRDPAMIEQLKQELNNQYQFEGTVSKSPSMQEIFKIAPQVAKSGSTVLIEGETGTGKEVLARALHNSSPRKNYPFVAINCGALPDNLLESELFGYKAGAFTHAVKNKPGFFAVAGNGTILLDEIGDTSSVFQTKLLRVLEEKEFIPLGSSKPVKTNASVIAATNKNLSELVDNGTFRQDLFYRVNVIRLELPPLKKRKEDIPLLVDRFIARRNELDNRSIRGIDEEALHYLLNYDYPGNIRELENIIERAFILCQEDFIRLNHIYRNGQSHSSFGEEQTGHYETGTSNEAKTIRDAISRHCNNIPLTAKELGMHRSTLYRKLKKMKIDLPITNS
ncbi:MAG: sigma 54-interacting transcriptional regulator [Deltaproteobacteria bacterium]|nr:sigma 54-interacting transcriptional regulator [Deltaproteobacteria bacterium]MBT4090071.1 sigma 54-interacting transcriptional regulator [Deltaproteobacteria bacterium]MBT4265854.1 sigma 54-interacting transcriptional regulator [Deltaproteobacteria bacterium]MBT4642855.1 sigma 54-interacting transcriptional regulator [Deltaproteobacteria bacterium]MBT6502698.1 sigma 54-interacting transcriptional regulator [Deltaproteobacteria bacterium]